MKISFICLGLGFSAFILHAEELPQGIALEGRPGFVKSPFAAPHQIVDVTGLPEGMEVKCPYSGKLFRVPPPFGAAIETEAQTTIVETPEIWTKRIEAIKERLLKIKGKNIDYQSLEDISLVRINMHEWYRDIYEARTNPSKGLIMALLEIFPYVQKMDLSDNVSDSLFCLSVDQSKLYSLAIASMPFSKVAPAIDAERIRKETRNGLPCSPVEDSTLREARLARGLELNKQAHEWFALGTKESGEESENKRYGRAIQTFKAALKEAEDLVSSKTLANIYSNLGRLYENLEIKKESLHYYQLAVIFDPNNVEYISEYEDMLEKIKH